MAAEHRENSGENIHTRQTENEGRRAVESGVPSSGETLTRQVTVPLSPEVYERLFFQPNTHRGDLSQRLGNPTLLGLLGFLIPYQSTMLALLQTQGSSIHSLTALSGSYFLGGIVMVLAGIFELILGNTFLGTLFVTYGGYWYLLGYNYDPLHNVAGAYGAEGVSGTMSQNYNAGNGFLDVAMCMVSCIFFLGSLRTNGPVMVLLLSFIALFAFLAASNFYLGWNPDTHGVQQSAYLAKVGGGFGFIAVLCGWYLAIIAVCASTGVPCPLPTFDFSHAFEKKKRESREVAADDASTREVRVSDKV